MMKMRFGAFLLTGILLAGGCGFTSVCLASAEEMTAKQETEEESKKETAGGSKFVKQEITIPEITVSQREIPDTEAMQYVKEMKLGWNLGNTFDAMTVENLGGDELKYESLWCGTPTTEEMIRSVKEAGFETVRIPVSWHNHLDADLNISEAWLNRVQEVVDYAMDADLHVIINIHHDNDPAYDAYFYPDSEHLEQSITFVTRIWEQLAERFADYDDRLIFEALNEPRLVGTQYEWWLDHNSAACKDAVACLNQLMQAFTDTVRRSGGRNAERYLMIPGYCASVEGAVAPGFCLPEDTAKDRLIVSVHAYTPYNFALQSEKESGSVSGFSLNSKASTAEIDSLMNRLYDTWVSQGVPVVIGEFGARMKEQNLQDRTDWVSYYVASASAAGIPCCWWDNNSFVGDGENFGLLSRILLKWRYQDLIDAMQKYAM